MAKLKVFRTPIGFHDAFVAAPSRKAALRAWGSDADLFARGVAEEVTDPALTAEPLAHPGEVIRRTRGSLEEQLAALPPDRPKAKAAAKTKPAAPEKAAKRRPRPSRAALDAAEDALAATERRHHEERAELRREEEALARRRKTAEAAQAKEAGDLEHARDAAKRDWEEAVARWEAGRD